MNVAVAYANHDRQEWIRLEIPDESTVEDAIKASGILQRYPEIDLETQKVGIYGKFSKLNQTLSAGDRVEIYRQITRVLDEDDDDDDDD